MNGKGDTPRPRQVSQEVWEENWNNIFNTQTYEEWLKDQDDSAKNNKDV